MPHTEINGLRLYYELHGKGDPLLLIPGLGCDSSVWLPVLDELSSHYRCIVFDTRGTGRSDTPETPYTIRDLADDARRLLDYMEMRSAHVVGHSMGGYIAQELAINHPEHVNKLILESTGPVSSRRNNLFFNITLKWLQEGMDLESWLRGWFFWLFTPACFRDRDYINTFIKEALEYSYPQSVPGYKGQIEAIATFDTRDRLSQIQAETLVIEGREDILITPREAEALAAGIPNASMLYIENAAHRLHEEQPEMFSRAVPAFFAGHERSIL